MIVFFGHQSVGAGIVAGVGELAAAGATSWRTALLEEPVPSGAPLLLHQKVGTNGTGASKLDDFERLLRSMSRPPTSGPNIDVAMVKFCYVDVRNRAQAQELLRLYWQRMQSLQDQHERIRFAHCTVPLRQLPSGPYAWLRRVLGHRHPEFEANAAREWFNDQLRAACAEDGLRGRLFDLATLQSTHADGRRCRAGSHRDAIASLAPEWTYDGGHLNARGRTMAAGAFLQFLQTLP
jgi:hypothetical protein